MILDLRVYVGKTKFDYLCQQADIAPRIPVGHSVFILDTFCRFFFFLEPSTGLNHSERDR